MSNLRPPLTYVRLGRFEAARRIWTNASARGFDGPAFHQILLERALIQDDGPEIATQVRWFEGRDDEYLSLDLQASRAIVRGERRKAAELLARAAAGAQLANAHQAADLLAEAARSDPFGDCQVRDNLIASLRACADLTIALRDAEALSKERPADTLLSTVDVPLRRAAVALARNRADEAIELLKNAAAFEQAYPEVIYVRAKAYLRAGKAAAALTEFEKIIDHLGGTWGPRYPLAYLGQARAAVHIGDTKTARRAYDALLALWADADADIPLVIEARKERAALHE